MGSMDLSSFHRVFPGSIRWRITEQGIEIEDAGPVRFSAPAFGRARRFATAYRAAYITASAATGVPVELVLACSLTEAAVKNPEASIREEPGYISDEKTPDRISAGMCQLLISTARLVMGQKNIDRAWLLIPANSILACAGMIRRQRARTHYDPICVACAYNAGGLYENANAKNRWRLRQFPIGTSHHADRFAEYFNAAMELSWEGAFADQPCTRYRDLLTPKAA